MHRLQKQSSLDDAFKCEVEWVIQGVAARGVFSQGGLWGAVSAKSKKPGVCGVWVSVGALLCVC